MLNEILKLCTENGIKVDITTNGTLLEENKEFLLNNPVRQVNISIHSFEDETPDEYLSTVTSFAKEITEKTPTVVVLRQWVQSQEDDRAKTYFMKAFDVNSINVQRSTKLKDNVFLNQAEQFDWPSVSMPHISNRGFCYGMRSQVGILVCGTVVPCCLDGDGVIALGNIYEDSFENIVNSPRATLMAENFSRRLATEDLCRKCTYKLRFN